MKVFAIFLIFAYLSCFSCSKHPLLNDVLKFISTQPTKTQFKLWHYAFNKQYDINSEEGLLRYKAFKENLNYIKEENNKNQGFTLGLGPFSDLSWEEFSKNYLTYKGPELNYEEENRKLGYFDDMVDLEDSNSSEQEDEDNEYDKPEDKVSIDWSYLYNYVKDQSPCGSCWAHAAVGIIEAYALQNNYDSKFSEQQLVDCNKLNTGCNGGTQSVAFKYLREFGIMKLNDYPYTGRDDPCKFDASKVAYKILSYKYCSMDAYFCHNKRIMELIKKGPYATAIHAGRSMQHYREGAIAPKECKVLNHAVISVKVDLEEGKIKIRNSWGEDWGVNGYGWIILKEHTGRYRGCGLLEEAFQVEKAERVSSN